MIRLSMQNPKFSQKVHKLNDFITAAEYSLCWPLDFLNYHSTQKLLHVIMEIIS